MMKLVIGNKLYSSWSMRPWLVMRAFGIPFEELLVPFGQAATDPAWKAQIAAYTPAGKVPALVDGSITLWETLAIIEYLAESHPDLPIWPRDKMARAMARAIANEMHAGFQALRGACMMNLGKRFASRDRGEAVSGDVARIVALWKEARECYGAAGPFLFGSFSAADAMYAPVTARLRGYSIKVDRMSEAYIDAVQAHPAYQQWRKEALAEPWIIASDEVDEPVLENYRKAG
jgi:glutathione S-transferase